MLIFSHPHHTVFLHKKILLMENREISFNGRLSIETRPGKTGRTPLPIPQQNKQKTNNKNPKTTQFEEKKRGWEGFAAGGRLVGRFCKSLLRICGEIGGKWEKTTSCAYGGCLGWDPPVICDRCRDANGELGHRGDFLPHFTTYK